MASVEPKEDAYDEYVDLKTPWIPYPNRYRKPGIDIFSEYNNSESLHEYFLSEIRALNTFIISKAESDYDFVFVATGAVMDDFYAQSVEDSTSMNRIRRMGCNVQEIWWRLMFPYQLEKFKSDNPDSKILILIIAPDKHFNISTPKYHHPRFMDYFHTYGWKYLGHNAWNSSDDSIEVRLFNCPVPGFSSKQNDNIEHQKIRVKDDEVILPILNRLTNNDTDFCFVRDFYRNLDTLFKKTEEKDGLIMSINGAVINSRDERSTLGNFYFIKDLCPLFNKDTPKRLLGSWVYNDFLSHYYIYLNYKIDSLTNTSFIKPSIDKDQEESKYLLPQKTKYYLWKSYIIDDFIDDLVDRELKYNKNTEDSNDFKIKNKEKDKDKEKELTLFYNKLLKDYFN